MGFAVHLGEAARRVIGDALFERREELRHGETGGFLYCLSQRPGGVAIIGASDGSGTRQDEHGALLDPEEAFRIDDKLRAAYQVPGSMLTGSWHNHPPGSDVEPSDADKRHWLSMFDALTRRGWKGRVVGVIAGADYHGTFFVPTYKVWCVYRQPHNQQPVCEPAELVETR